MSIIPENHAELTPIQDAWLVHLAVDTAAQVYHEQHYISFPVRDESGNLSVEFIDARGKKHHELNFWAYHTGLRERFPWADFPYPIWITMVGRRMSDIRNHEREEALQRDREEMNSAQY